MKTQQIAQVLGTTEVKNFEHPDEVREFPKGRLELIHVGGVVVGRAILEPGWRWSESVQSIAGTDSCEAAHFQYHVSGTLMVRMDDGTEYECQPGRRLPARLRPRRLGRRQ